ncbi:MAG: carboxypeptidase-like regulatory domain-containing protein [Proteobacteria bacterium]|nr:carboxypeptidase-like regulatory domain-containing protein [Pseudomonadota bacterium]MBU1387865.1 carboxypeptidase-like regulatory domain-containing protein [Pseudomonadota bacterium]MBU1541348.1 carboxypeptidase-like regulatory domain-containing protein [Pseudomonadota bacterium]MBU2482166.1 carboxypeptidase-like regulatory domain-containing protein [Pseudomonadota bacterium]
MKSSLLKVSISFLPGTQISEGMKTFYLTVTSSNYQKTDIGLYLTVTASGIGNVLFKASDIYTGTFNAKNELIRGLANAKITMQRDMSTDSPVSATTDSLGEVLFEDLVVGSYKCVVTAANHQQYTGRIWVKPGITVNKPVFLEYNLVTVEWEVNEITIEDKYEILLTATFETDVPAAVVVAEPLSVTLPDMQKGDVYHGEFILTNHGLIRAEDLTIPIPYLITCLKSLDQEDSQDGGGGCYTYTKCLTISYGYTCANGGTSKGSTRHCFYKSGGICGSTGSGVSSGGGTTGETSVISSTALVVDDKKCLPKPDPKECNECKETGQNTETSIGSAINTVYRQFVDDAVDMFIQTPGGRIIISREYENSKWSWNFLSTVMDGREDDNLKVTRKAISVLSEYGPDYVTKDHVPYEKVSPDVYKNDTQVLWFEYDADARQVTYEYSGDNLVCVVALMEKQTLYEYDSKNNLTKKTNAAGHATIITYNQTNDPIS